jgi:hypothetical protein
MARAFYMFTSSTLDLEETHIRAYAHSLPFYTYK